MYHEGLDDTRHLSAREVSVLQGKIKNQVRVWEKKWKGQVAIQDKKDNEEQAMEMTAESKEALKSIEGLLAHTLDIDDAVDWDKLKINKANIPTKLAEIPKQPHPSKYLTKPPFFTALFKGVLKNTQRNKNSNISKLWKDGEKLKASLIVKIIRRKKIILLLKRSDLYSIKKWMNLKFYTIRRTLNL